MTTERQRDLLEFMKQAHGDQKRKYTGEPYWHHPVAVAERVGIYEDHPLAWEVAILHDVIEDTEIDPGQMVHELIHIGYSVTEANLIALGVDHLTDRFTSERYPDHNRAQRKAMEAKRLGSVPNWIQSIKYADLIDNTSSITEYDPSFAMVYLKEKRQLIDNMRNGNVDLLIQCCASLKQWI